MTTSKETDWMNHPRIRALVEQANALSLAERVTLIKGLVPGIAKELDAKAYEGFVSDIRLKGERFREAVDNPGQGRAARQTPGERDVEGR